MKYLHEIFQFLKTYDYILMPVLFVLLVIFGIANWVANPYRKQNKKFAKCTEMLLHKNTCNEQSLRILPEEYQRQWRAYVRSGANKPSQTMEFVKRKTPLRWVLPLVVLIVLSLGYGVLFFANIYKTGYVWFAIVFAVTLALVLVLNAQINYANEKKARIAFAKFALQLNKAVATEEFSVSAKRKAVEKAISVIEQTKTSDQQQEMLKSVTDVLREKGLNGVRTVEEQRKLNSAINGLLQAYARRQRK